MTVRAVGSSHGISHECRAMRCETKSQTHHRILHMKTIIDQLDSDAWILNSSRNWTRLAMMQAIHRIEHVRHNARARVETLASGRIIGIAMSYRRNHSGRREATNRINAVRQFGGDGDLTQTAACRLQKPINIFGNRILQTFRIMRTLARQRKERSFQMRAENVRAGAHHAVHGLKIGAHHVKRIGDQTEHLAGGAVHHVTRASQTYALHAIIEGTAPRTVRMNVNITGSHHATCSVGYGTGRTGHGIAGISRTDRIGISIGIQTDACASRSKISVPIPSRNNRATIGNQPIMFRNTSRIDFARIANRKRTGRLRQRNVHIIRKPLTRLFHLHTFQFTPSHIPQLASNSSIQWKNYPADKPISNPILPVSGEILPLTATSESQFLQSVEESGLPNTPVLPKTFQRVEESSRWKAEKRPECSSEWKNPDASGHRLRSSNQMCCQAGLWA